MDKKSEFVLQPDQAIEDTLGREAREFREARARSKHRHEIRRQLARGAVPQAQDGRGNRTVTADPNKKLYASSVRAGMSPMEVDKLEGNGSVHHPKSLKVGQFRVPYSETHGWILPGKFTTKDSMLAMEHAMRFADILRDHVMPPKHGRR